MSAVAPGGGWQRERRAVRGAAAGGALLGGLVALVAFAPASWLGAVVARATEGRLLLADARGSVWRGSALPVLTGGAGSRDAAALPSRLHWRLAPSGLGLALTLRQACCIAGGPTLRVEAGIGGWRLRLPASAAPLAQWPAAWLAGLGTPFNTLQLGGTLTLASPGGFAAEQAAGRWRFEGGATLGIDALASRLVTLPVLGSYRLELTGGAAATGPAAGADAQGALPAAAGVPRITLSTTAGPLLMDGQGTWSAAGLRFRGTARAAPGAETALANLLNLIGRRQGALSVLSIG